MRLRLSLSLRLRLRLALAVDRHGPTTWSWGSEDLSQKAIACDYLYNILWLPPPSPPPDDDDDDDPDWDVRTS
ncbi:GL14831 [Drosophila persimilis]|uniref:GL14831 n=1 Tax=Drosophila persimilis TaxID=7234 RepID=B4H0K1_DROPE|nr:GL14831 [Drosophila persimilis]